MAAMRVCMRLLCLMVAVVMLSEMMAQFPGAAALSTAPAIDPAQFETPGIRYRPGVRWWLPGGAIEPAEMEREIDLLADNGFGCAEINPFGKTGSLVIAHGDFDPYIKYDTPEYYEALEAAVARAAQRGITIDLNMGSSWNANDPDVTLDQSLGNMAVGKSEVSVAIGAYSARDLSIPQMITSSTYTNVNSVTGTPMLTAGGTAALHCLVIGKILKRDLQKLSRSIDSPAKSDQLLIDPATITVIDLSGGSYKPGDAVSWTPMEAGDYAVISVFSYPTGGLPVDSVNMPRVGVPSSKIKVAYVIDHLDRNVVAKYMEEWMGAGTPINRIEKKHPETVRAYFNDSYELRGDVFYNNALYALAKNKAVLGYDFTPHLPLMYKLSNVGRSSAAAADTFFTVGKIDKESSSVVQDADVNNRIFYDYFQLINKLFLEGMDQFSATAHKYGGVYRQQAYNPPIDTIGSAKYVDIPEGEQLNENTLKRTASGSHLYNRPLTTAEQFTLRNTPFNNDFNEVRNGLDLQATSGINNFFYHGFSYRYFGDAATRAAGGYGETAFSGFFTIGISVSEADSLWPYYKDLNAYASRLNYLMQQGEPSMDVALYMPFGGSVNNTAGAGKDLNDCGYAWDVINNEAIQTMAGWDAANKAITISGSKVAYKAIVVQDAILPLATMEALQTLAAKGAAIVFYGEKLPSQQPGYANGSYAALDARVAAIAAEMNARGTAYPKVSRANNSDTLAKALGNMGTITYERNANLRFIRRTLSDGGEVAYFRNTASAANAVAVRVPGIYKNCYWLDQSTGKIFKAAVVDGKLAITLDALRAVAFLCEPSGVAYADNVISTGVPASIDTTVLTPVSTLTEFALTVTADNFGTYAKGSGTTTKTYIANTIGNWKENSFQNGELMYVNAPGIYKTTLVIDNISAYAGKSCFLDCGNVQTVAEVKVNGEKAGTLIGKPFRVDISRYLKQGENAIEIKVTPRTYNRYIGFSKAFDASDKQDSKYRWYSQISSARALSDAGLIGPITLYSAAGGVVPLR
jgi:hypothetical protein